jgi:hypothetical protein
MAFRTVEISGAAFYEAVAPCLAATNRLPELPRDLNAVKVSVADVRVEHEVKTMDFTKSFEETNGSPREVSDRLNSINSQPPCCIQQRRSKLKRAGLIAGERRFVLSAFRCGISPASGNWAVREIEPDAKDRIYYDAKDLQNLLANHDEKMEITSRTLQAMASQVHGYGDTFWLASAGKARIPLASMMRK